MSSLRTRVVVLVLALACVLPGAGADAETPQRLARPAAALEPGYGLLLSHDLLWAAALSAERELWRPLAQVVNDRQRELVAHLAAAANLRFSAFRFKTPGLAAAFFDLQTDLAALQRLYAPSDEGLLSLAKSVETRLWAFNDALLNHGLPDTVLWPEVGRADDVAARVRLYAAQSAIDAATPAGREKLLIWLHLLETDPPLLALTRRLDEEASALWDEPQAPILALFGRARGLPLARLQDLQSPERRAAFLALLASTPELPRYYPLLPRPFGAQSAELAPLREARLPVNGETLLALATGEAHYLVRADLASLPKETADALFSSLAAAEKSALEEGALFAWLLQSTACEEGVLGPRLSLALWAYAADAPPLAASAAPLPPLTALEAAPPSYALAAALFERRAQRARNFAQSGLIQNESAKRLERLAAAFSALSRAASAGNGPLLLTWPDGTEILRDAVARIWLAPARTRLIVRSVPGLPGGGAKAQVMGVYWQKQRMTAKSGPHYMTLRLMFGEATLPMADAAAAILSAPGSLPPLEAARPLVDEE